jgi:hypothetical protein
MVAARTNAEKASRIKYADKAWEYFNKAIELSSDARRNTVPSFAFPHGRFIGAYVERARASYICRANECTASLARDLLRFAEAASDVDAAELIFFGYHLLGLLAHDRGDLEEATICLLKSVECVGSPRLNSFGPSMMLAMRLLRLGQSEAVLGYLEKCSTFWEGGRENIDRWSEDIRRGVEPDFGYNLNLWQSGHDKGTFWYRHRYVTHPVRLRPLWPDQGSAVG